MQPLLRDLKWILYQVMDEDFEELRKHYDDEAIAEIVRLIAMMSFYNKWNDTIATTVEKLPFDMAFRSLSWWGAGKHTAS